MATDSFVNWFQSAGEKYIGRILQFSFFPYDRKSKIFNHAGYDDVTRDCLIIFDKGLHNQEKYFSSFLHLHKDKSKCKRVPSLFY